MVFLCYQIASSRGTGLAMTVVSHIVITRVLSAAAAFFGCFLALQQKSDKSEIYSFRILPEILS
jgi:hypothetical protein